jgi:hypothetical protein
MVFGGRRPCTLSIHRLGISERGEVFGPAQPFVSNRPIWLAEAAEP